MVLSAQGIFKSSLHFVFDFHMGTGRYGDGFDSRCVCKFSSDSLDLLSDTSKQDHPLRVNMRKVSGETKVKLVKYESVSRPERCNGIVPWKLLVTDSGLVSVAVCISLVSFSYVGAGSIGFNQGWDFEREASKGSRSVSM